MMNSSPVGPGSKSSPAVWEQDTLLDALLLIFLTIKFAYFPQGVTIKKKNPTVALFLADPVTKSRLTRCESEPLH